MGRKTSNTQMWRNTAPKQQTTPSEFSLADFPNQTPLGTIDQPRSVSGSLVSSIKSLFVYPSADRDSVEDDGSAIPEKASTTLSATSPSRGVVERHLEAAHKERLERLQQRVQSFFSHFSTVSSATTAPKEYEREPSVFTTVSSIVMGCLFSKPPLISFSNGTEKEYRAKYIEEPQIIGEGEFGIVKLVRDMEAETVSSNNSSTPWAVKILRKGVVFKDNTLYAPLKPEVLQLECKILQTLAGQQYCLKLVGIYESPSIIYIITEYCSGGEMVEYVSNTFTGGLRIEDASRIAHQLLSAVNHCAKHNVIHRDIKPQNVMFRTGHEKSDLRLIDFGSGTMDNVDPLGNAIAAEEKAAATSNGTLVRHSTFAGSAFYISPEMFQRTYTSKTDVWSVGATLYVLVAGYPADELQKAFNILQTSTNRNLKTLPNMPPDMPDTFYELLDALLTYRHKERKSAADILKYEFCCFHSEHDQNIKEQERKSDVVTIEEIAAAAAEGKDELGEMTGSERTIEGTASNKLRRTRSMVIPGSVSRHTAYLAYEKFERSVTTLLATVLDKEQLKELSTKISTVLNQKSARNFQGEEGTELDNKYGGDVDQSHKLQIIKVGELIEIMTEMKFDAPISMMQNLPNAMSYTNFAYHVALLRQFIGLDDSPASAELQADIDDSVHRKMGRVMTSLAQKKANSATVMIDSNGTLLDSSGHAFRRPVNNSVHGNNVWDSVKNGASKRRGGKMKKAMSGFVKKDILNRSSHL